MKLVPEHRKLSYGGVEHTLNSFHYRSTSTVSDHNQKKGATKKFEYIDANEDAPIIYRWEVKGALATQMKNKNGKLQHRVFTPFTLYKSSNSTDQYICLATMTVRCSSRRFDFLVQKVGSTQTPEIWCGLERMKQFYACPEFPVDHSMVKKDRLRYWDCEQHIYKEDRLILLDTRYPSNKTLPQEKQETVKERFEQWIVLPGRLKAHEESMLEAQAMLESRSLRKQEEKALKDSLKRVKELETLIEGHVTNKITKSSAEKKSKRPRRQEKSIAKIDLIPVSLKDSCSGTSVAITKTSSMERQINQLLAEISQLKKMNTSASRTYAYQEVSPPSKRISDLEKAAKEEDLKLALMAKKRKVAEEEQELAEFKAAKKRLKLESIAHANQLLREGELERVKIKVLSDQIQQESALRQQSISEEDRRRRNDYDDSKRRQQLQFSSEEHALMLEKERARIKYTDSTLQHNQLMQMVALSQRPNELSLIMEKSKQQQSVDSKWSARAVTSIQNTKKCQTGHSSKNDDERLLTDLRRQLEAEKVLQSRIRAAATSALPITDDIESSSSAEEEIAMDEADEEANNDDEIDADEDGFGDA